MNYEVFEVLEAGSAGVTILDKPLCDFDEFMEPIGCFVEALDE